MEWQEYVKCGNGDFWECQGTGQQEKEASPESGVLFIKPFISSEYLKSCFWSLCF